MDDGALLKALNSQDVGQGSRGRIFAEKTAQRH